MKRAARFITFYAALLGLWTLLAELKIWPPYLFPTPWGVGEALYAGFQDHTLLDRDPRQHGARDDRLRHLCRAWDDSWTWRGQQ